MRSVRGCDVAYSRRVSCKHGFISCCSPTMDLGSSAIVNFLRLTAMLALALLMPIEKVFAMSPPVLVAIGKQAPLGEFSATVDRATLSGSVITIGYSVRNIGPSPAPLAGFPKLWLEDRKGGALGATQDTARDGMLAPGATASRTVRFTLPPGAVDPMAWLLRFGGEMGARSTLR